MTVRSQFTEWLRESRVGQAALAATILVLITLVAYHNSFRGAFVLDDQSNIVENASIRKLWPLGTALMPPSEAGTSGRPFANFTYALNYSLSGLQVKSYHVVNVVLLALAAFVLFNVLHRSLQLPILRDRFGESAWLVALAVAGLWALHPLASSAVDYLSQRTEELVAVFYLSTFYFFLRSTKDHASPAWSVLAVTACLFGMASKETMVTAPLMVVLYDRTFISGTFRTAWKLHWRLHTSLAATWCALAAFMAGARLSARGIGFDLGVPWFTYALTQCQAVVHYLRLSLWPDPLIFDYGWKFERSISGALPAALLLGSILGVVVWAILRRPKAGFLGAWFFVLLAPSSSVVPLTEQPIAESRVFLALAAIPALVVSGLYLWSGRRSLLLWAPVALLLGIVTFQRHDAYRSALILWSDTVAKFPENARAHNNLGAALVREKGREVEAAAHFATALKLRPDYADAHNNVGAQLQRAGRYTEAIAQFQSALRINPSLAEAYYNLGLCLAETGRGPEAITAFETTLQLKPENSLAHNNLGTVFLDLGRVDEAIEHDLAATRIDPDLPEAHYNLGNALVRKGESTGAIDEFKTALGLRPDYDKAHNNLGTVLLQRGQVSEAITHFEAALKIRPEYPVATSNLKRARQLQNSGSAR